jgi:hypothetical protein
MASIKVGKVLRENYSEKELNEALKILNEASEKLEAIQSKLKGEKA